MNNILNLFKPNSNQTPPTTLQSLSLVPDRPNLTYNAGELVTGHCILTVNGTLDISQVEIKLAGKAKVEIPVSNSQQQQHQQHHNNHNVHHHNQHDSHISNVMKKDCSILRLVYNPATVYNSQLTTGRHDIGFSFMIPSNVPSSYEHQLGSIRYNLKAKVNGCTVNNADLKLNILSSPAVHPNELLAQITIANEKTVGLIGGKKVTLKCEIPQTGFTLGSTIPVTCYIANTSKKPMTLRGSIKQEVTFRADAQHFRTINNKLVNSDGPQIEPRSEARHQLDLHVPVNLPIVHNTCPLISIKYIASVKLDIPGSFDLVCKSPILLTNQPINPAHQQQGTYPMLPTQMNSPPNVSQVMPPIPPPESMSMPMPMQMPQPQKF